MIKHRGYKVINITTNKTGKSSTFLILVMVLLTLSLLSLYSMEQLIVRRARVDFLTGSVVLSRSDTIIKDDVKSNINVVKDNITVRTIFCPREHCVEELIKELRAELKKKYDNITCFFYQVNLEEFLRFLKEHKGILVVDANFDLDDINEEFINAGFIIKFNNTKGLMHMKFCILNDLVILGSYNPTERGNYYNNNNLVIIKSKALAGIYKERINQLITNQLMSHNHNLSDEKSRKTRIIIVDEKKNISLESCFSPEEDCRGLIISELKKSKKNILFAAFSFTDKKIGLVLKEKWDNGVDNKGIDVKGVIESRFYSRTPMSIRDFTVNDTNPYNMHHKFFIIDNKTVITGSYNPTYKALYNNENLVIIKSERVASDFLREFNYLWEKDKERIKENKVDSKARIRLSALPNPIGRDDGKEFIIIKNEMNTTLNLDYCFLNISVINCSCKECYCRIQRLNGLLMPNESLRIKPKYSLRNKNGRIILFNETHILSVLSWQSASEGEVIT